MPMESSQDKEKRVRPPRVTIDCKVDTGGAEPLLELPFVVGILADLTGQADPEKPRKKYTEREFVQIDRDNFNSVLKKAAPRIAIQVPDRLSEEEGKLLNVVLNFTSMDDFHPGAIANQVKPLKQLVEAREKLKELLSKMEGNDALESLLMQVIANTENRDSVAQATGGSGGSAPDGGDQGESGSEASASDGEDKE